MQGCSGVVEEAAFQGIEECGFVFEVTKNRGLGNARPFRYAP
jgi:hypothetical protein